MVVQSTSFVRAPALRRSALSSADSCSIGLRSGVGVSLTNANCLVDQEPSDAQICSIVQVRGKFAQVSLTTRLEALDSERRRIVRKARAGFSIP